VGEHQDVVGGGEQGSVGGCAERHGRRRILTDSIGIHT
jgi:hypothetical protein